MDCCSLLEARIHDAQALSGPGLPDWKEYECAAAPGAPALKVARGLDCLSPARRKFLLELRYALRPAGVPGDRCTCKIRYDVVGDWDERGGDLACGGAPFCKVCGGLPALYAACDADARCAGFVRYYNLAYLKDSRVKARPQPKDMCGYLKGKMRDADTIGTLKFKGLETGPGAARPLPASFTKTKRAVPDEDKWPGMRDPALAKEYALEEVDANGFRSNWQTFVKTRDPFR